MKLIHILLGITLILCISGIGSAANNTDMSKMVDMDQVKSNAMDFWTTMNKDSNVGYLLLGAALAVCLVIIIGVAIIGSGRSALGKKVGDSNATNEGRGNVVDALKAAAGLVIALLVLSVVFGLL